MKGASYWWEKQEHTIDLEEANWKYKCNINRHYWGSLLFSCHFESIIVLNCYINYGSS
jgi:hypothetical protein